MFSCHYFSAGQYHPGLALRGTVLSFRKSQSEAGQGGSLEKALAASSDNLNLIKNGFLQVVL